MLRGVILSAGASSRWQGEPKALLRIGSETALARIARLMDAAGVGSLRIVVGAHGAAIRTGTPRALRDRVEWLDHPDWERGRTGSVQAGLAGLDTDDVVVLWPVDQPFVAASTLPRLLTASAEDALATWVLPQYGDHGGHPIVLKPPAWRLVLGLRPDEPLNHLIPRLGPSVLRLRVDDPGAVVNLNTPDDYWTARSEGLPREE